MPCVILDKNFCNYPIARNANRQVRWRYRLDGSISCVVPGERNIALRMPEVQQRLINAFDLSVLCTIAANAEQQESSLVQFNSIGAFLKQLGYGNDTGNARKLKEALEYLAAVRVRFGAWYIGYGRRSKRNLLPPLSSFDIQDGIQVKLDSEWYKIFMPSDNSVRLPLPFPRDATVLNLILWIAAWRQQSIRATTLCRKVGLLHSQRRAYLRAAFEQANAYFEQYGGYLIYTELAREFGLAGEFAEMIDVQLVGALRVET